MLHICVYIPFILNELYQWQYLKALNAGLLRTAVTRALFLKSSFKNIQIDAISRSTFVFYPSNTYYKYI